MLRSLLERISRGVVLKRRLPPEFGRLPLFVSPDASLRYWKRDLRNVDAALLAAAKSLVRPGDVVWDIGANIGLFTFAAAGLAGRSGAVLAVEPDPWLAQLLRKSATLEDNAGYRIDVLSVVAGECRGTAILNIARRGRAANFVLGAEPSTQAGGVRATVRAECVTLDSLLDAWPAPSVVKIDVEGAEATVLRGARQLLAAVRPRILCEVASANRAEVTAAFNDASYALYDATQAPGDSAPITECAWNTIAIPAEHRR